MTGLLDATDLWWKTPEVCTCACPDEDFSCPHDTTGGWPVPLLSFDIDGALYITNRFDLLPASHLGGLPVGYGSLLTPLGGQAVDGFITWLQARPIPEPSDRVFDRRRLDLFEKAGYLIRPLEGVADAHGICTPELEVIGLTVPIREYRVDEAGDTARVVSR